MYESFLPKIRYQAAVLYARSLRGESGKPIILSPDDLTASNVIILDFEGAEKEILEELNTQPATMVVETHGWRGTSEGGGGAGLEEKSYEVVERSVVDKALPNKCEESGIYVLSREKMNVKSEKSVVIRISRTIRILYEFSYH